MTSSDYSTLGIALGGLIMLLTAIELIINKDQKGLKKITRIGWCILVVAIGTTLTGILGIRQGNAEKIEADSVNAATSLAYEKQISELDGKVDLLRQLSDEARRSIIANNDTNTQKIYAKFDNLDTSISRTATPLIGYLVDSTLGTSIKRTSDSIYITGHIVNKGSAAAFNVNGAVFIILRDKKGKDRKLVLYKGVISIPILPAGRRERYSYKAFMNPNKYADAKMVIISVAGKYSLDYYNSIEKGFNLGIKYTIDQNKFDTCKSPQEIEKIFRNPEIIWQ